MQVLGTDYALMEAEWPALEQVLPWGATVLVDSYYVTEDYLQRLETRGTVVYMDDQNVFPYPVTGIVNGNFYGDVMEYHVPIVMGGSLYAPLRREYSKTRDTGHPEYVMITTGGSDPYSITLKVLRELEKRDDLKDLPIRVVCGRFNQDFEIIKEMEQYYPKLKVLQNVPDMWNLMKDARVAITAAGTTLSELSCMGVPAICFSFADNQEYLTRYCREKNYVYFADSYLQHGDALIPRICDALEELSENPQLLEGYRHKAMALVDGRGSSRIAEVLIRLMQENVTNRR